MSRISPPFTFPTIPRGPARTLALVVLQPVVHPVSQTPGQILSMDPKRGQKVDVAPQCTRAGEPLSAVEME
ncbi:hypothetical protein E4U13_004598 [Claviceps humidiphila]|uniref:Uncharacterized protein n=1 Tax=Claviceps humidiphila TaxID=1294629 RepID=A0A9P7TT82_9HYPO|nr:hypothetical protein E4U13_004598 [Claviceps humidiphila]